MSETTINLGDEYTCMCDIQENEGSPVLHKGDHLLIGSIEFNSVFLFVNKTDTVVDFHVNNFKDQIKKRNLILCKRKGSLDNRPSCEKRHELVIRIGKTVGPDKPDGYKPEEPIDPKLAIELAHYLVDGSAEFDIAVGDWYASGRIVDIDTRDDPTTPKVYPAAESPMCDAPPVYSMKNVNDYGDATSKCDIEIHKTSTLRGWIKMILSPTSLKCGYIGITSDKQGDKWPGDPRIEYRHDRSIGDIPEEFLKLMDKLVKRASYFGGHNRGDWLFELED